MRQVAISLLLAWTALGITFPLAASPVVTPSPAYSSPTESPIALHEETPNERRRRLGQPIIASYPAPEYGEFKETPNERRRRLGLPVPGEPVVGSSEETPNHRRQREVAEVH